jgi:hypothetical protein
MNHNRCSHNSYHHLNHRSTCSFWLLFHKPMNPPIFPTQQLLNQLGWMEQFLIYGWWFIWVYVLIWTITDASSRTKHRSFIVLSWILVVVLSPIIWLPLYLLIRPQHRLHETTQRQETSLAKQVICPGCHRTNLNSYDHCVFCGHGIRIQCKQCKTQYPYSFHYCYKCWAPNLEIE